MHVQRYTIRTNDGWTLELHRGTNGGTSSGPPVLFVPGFGMNAFIFRYHPRGRSFMEHLLDRGFDPWSVDLRGQSSARAHPGKIVSIGLADHAFVDLPAAFDFISRTTGRERVHAIGCSLGGALLYGYGGAVADHRIDRLVTMGTPLRWTAPGLVVNAFASMAPLLGTFNMRGSRHAARFLLPVAAKLVPSALSIYLNPKITHTGPARELCRTVEDPHPRVNKQLGKWIRAKDLRLAGINVSESLRNLERPLLVVAGNADRICPAENAMAAMTRTGGPTTALIVGGAGESVSHADLFISDLVDAHVFTPVADWLMET